MLFIDRWFFILQIKLNITHKEPSINKQHEIFCNILKLHGQKNHAIVGKRHTAPIETVPITNTCDSTLDVSFHDTSIQFISTPVPDSSVDLRRRMNLLIEGIRHIDSVSTEPPPHSVKSPSQSTIPLSPRRLRTRITRPVYN